MFFLSIHKQICFVNWGHWFVKYWGTSIHEKKSIFLTESLVRAILESRGDIKSSYEQKRDTFVDLLAKTEIQPGQKPVRCSPAHLMRSFVAAANCVSLSSDKPIDQVSLVFSLLATEDVESKRATFVPNLVQQLIHTETLAGLGVQYRHQNEKEDEDTRESGERDLCELDWAKYAQEDDCSFSGFEVYFHHLFAFLDAANWLPLPKNVDIFDVFRVLVYSIGQEPCSCQYCQPVDKSILASQLSELARMTKSLLLNTVH